MCFPAYGLLGAVCWWIKWMIIVSSSVVGGKVSTRQWFSLLRCVEVFNEKCWSGLEFITNYQWFFRGLYLTTMWMINMCAWHTGVDECQNSFIHLVGRMNLQLPACFFGFSLHCFPYASPWFWRRQFFIAFCAHRRNNTPQLPAGSFDTQSTPCHASGQQRLVCESVLWLLDNGWLRITTIK